MAVVANEKGYYCDVCYSQIEVILPMPLGEFFSKTIKFEKLHMDCGAKKKPPTHQPINPSTKP